MLPVERQQRIKELILKKTHLKISELSAELGVSEMTIHRDLKPLIDEGLIIKTFGGIMLATDHPSTNGCVICNRNINERLAYRLIYANNKIEMTCCAHCGLIRHYQLGIDSVQAICHDFFQQTTISAPYAWFVMDTSINIGCCSPQVLTFELKDHADKFIKGFGGTVHPLSEAIEIINKKAHHCHD